MGAILLDRPGEVWEKDGHVQWVRCVLQGLSENGTVQLRSWHVNYHLAAGLCAHHVFGLLGTLAHQAGLAGFRDWW